MLLGAICQLLVSTIVETARLHHLLTYYF